MNYLRASGQQWKLTLGLAAVLAGGGLVLAGASDLVGVGDRANMAMFFGGLAASLFGLGWSTLSLRCVNCRLCVFWHALSGKDHQDGLRWVMTFTRCPACGHAPGVEPTR